MKHTKGSVDRIRFAISKAKEMRQQVNESVKLDRIDHNESSHPPVQTKIEYDPPAQTLFRKQI